MGGPARRRRFCLPAAGVGDLSIDGRPVVYATAEIPDDFPLRLCRLKEMTELNWSQFCEILGVSAKQMRRWRTGTEPSGGALMAIMVVAVQVSGGLDVVMGEGFAAALPEA